MRFTSRHLTVGVIAASLVLALCDVLWLDTYRYAVASPDFFVYYLAAQLGSAHGWTVIYDPSIFLPAERAVVGRPLPYLNPPELAWLVLPLSWLPYAIAAWIWKAILAAAFIVAWSLAAPGRRSAKMLYGVTAVVLLPVFISFFFGQVSVLIVAVVAGSWWLIRRDQPWVAGLTLSLLILKPQLAFLVPPALLLAGFGRVFVSWLLGTAVLGAAALLMVGPSVFSHVARSLALIQGVPGPVQLSLERQFPLPIAVIGIAIVLLAAGAVVLRARGRDPSIPMAAALIAGILVSPYINFYDLSAVVLAGWLVLQTRPRRWQWLILFGVYVALDLAPIWPVLTIAALGVWLVSLLMPWAAPNALDQPVTQAGTAAA